MTTTRRIFITKGITFSLTAFLLFTLLHPEPVKAAAVHSMSSEGRNDPGKIEDDPTGRDSRKIKRSRKFKKRYNADLPAWNNSQRSQRKTKLYLSKRFPFVHKRKTKRAYFIGTPNF